MSTNEFYKPVGGILSAELFPTRELSSIEDAIAGRGIAVELMDDGSLYEESFVEHDGLVSVEHTLTLKASRDKAQEWFSVELMQILAVEGAVARIEIATGEVIIVGHCQRMSFEQAMRMESLKFSSGQKPNTQPSVSLTLRCRDLSSAIGNGR